MMTDLTPAERPRFKLLVARLRKGMILPEEEAELRSLVNREFPEKAFTIDRERLGLLGLGMMAVWHYFPDESSDQPVSA